MDTLVATKYGTVRGTVLKDTKGNNTIFAFLGIPYAQPPIGDLRFKAPQPPEKWEGVKDATKEGNPCCSLQNGAWKNENSVMKIMGSEDCLYLNVYSKQLSGGSLKPVMFFIHGGGFVSGSSQLKMYGPQLLLTKDVVLVTINYRLGIFGFLAFDDASLEIPGNAAMKDMVQALSWVQENIKNFGGDPDNVTIFGQSSGGAAVNYLIVSSMAKGLFHKAIISSGTALCTWAHGQKTAPFLAKLLRVEQIDKEIFKILQNMTTEEVLELQLKCGDTISVGQNLKVFAPLVENSSYQGDKFLDKEAIIKMKSGDFNQVPIMLGFTSKETCSLPYLMEANEGTYRLPGTDDDSDFTPHLLNLKSGSEEQREVTKKIIEFYFIIKKKCEINTENYSKLLDDYFVNVGVHLASKIFAEQSKFPVYLYRFDFDTQLNLFKRLSGIGSPGAGHCDDLPYLFGSKLSPKIQAGSKEEQCMQIWLDLLTNFAKTGDPNKPNEQIFEDQWKPMSKDVQTYLNLGKRNTLYVAPYAIRMEFWQKIYENSPYSVNE